jgi:hypothetical protein
MQLSEKPDEIENRCHPTYDRKALRHVLTSVVIMASAFVGVALKDMLGSWAGALAFNGIMAGIVHLLSKPINVSACPTCRARLLREPNSIQFVCAACRIAWTTGVRGESIMDGFFARKQH